MPCGLLHGEPAGPVGWAELPRSPGHAFDRLQVMLVEAGCDGFAESQCAPFYASKWGRPSLPPGRYFACTQIGSPRRLATAVMTPRISARPFSRPIAE